MANSAALIAQEIETILRADCNAMVFPLRADTLSKIEKAVKDYGSRKYYSGQADGYEEGIQTRIQDEY
jgi:hypothetical protein